MGWSTTLAGWARRGQVLAACLAAAAALAVLAKPLGLPWLVGVGLVVAAAGALAQAVIAFRQARLEGAQELAELDRRVRVPIAPLAQVDPTVIGIDAASQSILPGGDVPDYVARSADASILAAVRAALEGQGRWIVVVDGSSKVGKSRSLFHALAQCSAGLDLVAPVDGDALRSLLTPGQGPRRGGARRVLWLDDLEPFLNQGISLQTLRDWRALNPGGIVAATYGGKGSDVVAASSSVALTTISNELLQQACEIALEATTARELEPLRAAVAPEVLAAVESHGLAAFLVAGPALQRKLSTLRHAPGEPQCSEGLAVVLASVDWARCGRTDPISTETLRALWPSYLPAATQPDDAAFDAGLQWALRPVAGTIALIARAGSFLAYDYVVRLVGGQADAAPPREQAWSSASADAADAQALAVGMWAYAYGRRSQALGVWSHARRSTIDDVAAIATLNSAVALADLGEPEPSIRTYDEVVARFGEAGEPALRETVAKALNGKGHVLGSHERLDECFAAYAEVIARFSDAGEPGLRQQVAVALLNTGFKLAELRRFDEALVAYDELLARFSTSTSTQPALCELIARALVNRGVALNALGRIEQAIASYDTLAELLGDAEESGVRALVLSAALNKGSLLTELGRLEQAIGVYAEIRTRYAGVNDPALVAPLAQIFVNLSIALRLLGRREQAIAACDRIAERLAGVTQPALLRVLGAALVSKGVSLDELQRSEEAVAAYDGALAALSSASDPMLNANAARALLNKGASLTDLGRRDEASAVYASVVERFSPQRDLPMRAMVAIARVRAAITLGERGLDEQAVAAYDEILEIYAGASEPALVSQVAKALVGRGVALGRLGRPLQALACYDELLARWVDPRDPELLEQVAKALLNKALVLAALGRHDEQLGVYAELLARFADAPDPTLRELACKALFGRGWQLRALGRRAQALDVFEELIARFDGASEPPIEELLGRARAERDALR